MNTQKAIHAQVRSVLTQRIKVLESQLDAVLNTEVPLASGKVKVRQFTQVQKAIDSIPNKLGFDGRVGND